MACASVPPVVTPAWLLSSLAVQLAFLLEAFAVKREYNLKVVKIREVRVQHGDNAAEEMQAEELDEAWYVPSPVSWWQSTHTHVYCAWPALTAAGLCCPAPPAHLCHFPIAREQDEPAAPVGAGL